MDRSLYRKHHHSDDLIYFTVTVKQTDLHIGACRPLEKKAGESVLQSRNQIEAEIDRYPEFLSALTPLREPIVTSPLLRAMYRATEKTETGPMAAVAGVIAEQTAVDLHGESQELIVENGGDCCIIGKRQRIIGIYAGTSPLSEKLGIRVRPDGKPIGICTSSGKLGHSLSLGNADAAVVVSRSTALADACATGLGNRVKTADDITAALEWAMAIQGVLGALVIFGDKMGAMGEIELVRL